MLNNQPSLDRIFHALADPTRRGMVERLFAGPVSVSELAKPLPMSLAAVVQHIQVLEACGLIHTEKNGRVRSCRLQAEALDAVAAWMNQRRQLWDQRLDLLGALLDTPKSDEDRSDA